jgi:hypothetical protein
MLRSSCIFRLQGAEMRVEELIRAMQHANGGKLLLQPVLSESDVRRSEDVRFAGICGVRGRSQGDDAAEGVEVAFSRLRAGTLRYGDLAALVAQFGAIFPEQTGDRRTETGDFLLALHDQYVLTRNVQCFQAVPLDESRGEGDLNDCRQCGECCIGPATGPISTSPADIRLWESLERDDLLYYTLPGSSSASVCAESLNFLACPFLRFSESGRGVCLVHPVKPLICREFVCPGG